VELRHKFIFLALIYVLSLAANLTISAYCIAIYVDSAFQDFQAGMMQEQEIKRLRRALGEQQQLLENAGGSSVVKQRLEALENDSYEVLNSLKLSQFRELTEEFVPQFEQALLRKTAVVDAWLARRDPSASAYQLPDQVIECFNEVGRLLAVASSALGGYRQSAFVQATQTQDQVVSILVANTAAGGILCAFGVFFVRRWVLNPVGNLREATRQISLGHFEHRIRPHSRDELGKLALEVNHMAATIVEMQTKMVEQERLAAAGEMVTRLAHNIRNPLAGIRGLSEATISLHADDEEVVGCQQRIIDTVDRFEKWLRDLQQSVSPLELHPKPVHIDGLLQDVVTALQPMLDRRQVAVEIDVDPTLKEVQLDSLHFEQAVVSLVTNAVQASASHQVVRMKAERVPEEPGRWCFSVEDQGAGIPAELREKIFEPYFTTKRDGNGIGLAMVTKVVRLHGGQLSVESEVGRGSRFEAMMPGVVTEA